MTACHAVATDTGFLSDFQLKAAVLPQKRRFLCATVSGFDSRRLHHGKVAKAAFSAFFGAFCPSFRVGISVF